MKVTDWTDLLFSGVSIKLGRTNEVSECLSTRYRVNSTNIHSKQEERSVADLAVK
jgi:hypothetical protein